MKYMGFPSDVAIQGSLECCWLAAVSEGLQPFDGHQSGCGASSEGWLIPLWSGKRPRLIWHLGLPERLGSWKWQVLCVIVISLYRLCGHTLHQWSEITSGTIGTADMEKAVFGWLIEEHKEYLKDGIEQCYIHMQQRITHCNKLYLTFSLSLST